MEDLRLIGVHEDGTHLLLTDAAGVRYRLPLDEALRAAARRDRPRLGQLQIEIEGGLRPRDVQALIRSGLSAAEVADRSGWTVEKVQRFEGPVLAEREFIAGQARAAILHRDGSSSQTLGERADERLRTRGVDPADAHWDSLRHESGAWVVTVTFAAGGRERSAAWRFDPQTKLVRAQNDDARWLGEDERVDPLTGAGTNRLSEEVFDVTTGMRSSRTVHAAPVEREGDELTESLRAHHSVLRRRRGRRRGAGHVPAARDTPQPLPIDALPGEGGSPDSVTPEPPRPVDEPTPEAGSGPASAGPASAGPASAEQASAEQASARPQPAAPEPPGEPEAPGDVESRGEPEALGDVESRGEPDPAGPGAAPGAAAGAGSPRAGGPRKGRRSVPSWDDVVFGTRPRPVDDD